MSGLLSLFRELAGIYAPTRVPAPDLFWACTRIAFGVSMVAAWGVEYKKVRDLEERFRSPDLLVEGNSAWWGDRADGALDMTIDISISNPFGPPSAVKDWKIEMNLPDKSVKGEIVMPTSANQIVSLSGFPERHITLRPETHLVRTSGAPVQAGAMSGGWVNVIFRGVTSVDIRSQKPMLTISCADVVSGKLHFCEMQLGDTPGIKIPGV